MIAQASPLSLIPLFFLLTNSENKKIVNNRVVFSTQGDNRFIFHIVGIIF